MAPPVPGVLKEIYLAAMLTPELYYIDVGSLVAINKRSVQ